MGYNVVLPPSADQGAVGIACANNDICYPSILATGQIMEAAKQVRSDQDRGSHFADWRLACNQLHCTDS